jgi:hypothetical protein
MRESAAPDALYRPGTEGRLGVGRPSVRAEPRDDRSRRLRRASDLESEPGPPRGDLLVIAESQLSRTGSVLRELTPLEHDHDHPSVRLRDQRRLLQLQPHVGDAVDGTVNMEGGRPVVGLRDHGRALRHAG